MFPDERSWRPTPITDPADPRLAPLRGDARARPRRAGRPLHRRGRGHAAADAVAAGPLPDRVDPAAARARRRARRGHRGLPRTASGLRRRPRRDEHGRGVSDPPRRASRGHPRRRSSGGAPDSAGARSCPRGRPRRVDQPRQCRRPVPQRRCLRRRRGAARCRHLRSALPQGDPRLGRRRTDRALRPHRGPAAIGWRRAARSTSNRWRSARPAPKTSTT